MADNDGAVKVKKSWWKGLKAEFKKIIWPSKEDLTKQSVAVIVLTIILGAVIALLDKLVQLGLAAII